MIFFCMFLLTALLKSTGASCYNGTDFPDCDLCGGECGSGNGCSCSNTTTCLPSSCSIGTNECCPLGLFWSNNCCSEDVTCIPSCAGDDVCTKINNVATCSCNKNIYKNKKIADLFPLVTCQSDVIITSLSRCLLDALGYNYSTFTLNNSSDVCTYTYPDIIGNQSVMSVQVKPQSGWCGNIATNDSSKIYYTNTLHIGIQKRPIITINPIELQFTCSYNLTMQTSLNYSLHPLLSTIYLPDINGNTVYPLTMAAYWNEDCTKPIETTETVDVGSYVYLGLFITGADGDNFALRAVQCFATPDNIDNSNRVQLVSGGCAVNGDVETVVLENGESLDVRIRINSFAFQGLSTVNIFCDVRLCDINSENCTECKHGRALETDTKEVVLSLNFEDKIDLSSSGSNTAVSWNMLCSSLLILLHKKLF